MSPMPTATMPSRHPDSLLFRPVPQRLLDDAQAQRELAELFPDLQAAADAALAELFPMLRVRPNATRR